MLNDLLEMKKELEPIVHECSVKMQAASREAIVRKRDYEVYGPLTDRAYLDNAIYVKVIGSGRDVKTEKVDIKNGLYMVFIGNDKPTTVDTMNKLKVSFESIDNKFISKILEICRRFKDMTRKVQTTLSKAAGMPAIVETNFGEASSASKFVITIKYAKEGVELKRENSKAAGSFRDTKTHINVMVEKPTESVVCEKLLNDIEKYFIGG